MSSRKRKFEQVQYYDSTPGSKTGRTLRARERKEIYDEQRRWEVHVKHLASLDQDNYLSIEGTKDHGDFDDEGDTIAKRMAARTGGTFPVRAANKNRKSASNFSQMLEIANVRELPPHVPSYITAAAKPSRYPPRHFCRASGYEATCIEPSTGTRYRGVREYNILMKKGE